MNAPTHEDFTSEELADMFVPLPKAKAPKKGERLRGSQWILVRAGGLERQFRGTLLTTINHGKLRLAIFSIPKRRRNKKARA